MKLKLVVWLFSFSLIMAACQPAPQAQSGDVLFQDDFSAGGAAWTRHADAGGIMDYDNENFRIQVNAAEAFYWATPEYDFDNVRVEVDAFKYAGPEENRMGVICRLQDEANFYFFIISTDGYYGIGKLKDGQSSLIDQGAMKHSPMIEQGLAINHIRAECVGNALRFFINGSPVALAQDLDFTHGDVGLLAGTFSEPGVDVLFDNFMVTVP